MQEPSLTVSGVPFIYPLKCLFSEKKTLCALSKRQLQEKHHVSSQKTASRKISHDTTEYLKEPETSTSPGEEPTILIALNGYGNKPVCNEFSS